jgi:hypothetical protein
MFIKKVINWQVPIRIAIKTIIRDLIYYYKQLKYLSHMSYKVWLLNISYNFNIIILQ